MLIKSEMAEIEVTDNENPLSDKED